MDGIVFCLEIIGTVAFAFSGAMVGIRKKFDLFGILMMGIITSVGGGVTRDVILNVSPPIMFEDPTYCIVAAVSSMLMFFPFVRKFLDNKFVHGMIFVAVDSLGLAAFTVAAVMFTGILGNLAAPFLVKLFRVRDPLAVGLGIGACSHAVGTAKALEMGETEGAMGGLAIGLCGIITTVLSLFFELLV